MFTQMYTTAAKSIGNAARARRCLSSASSSRAASNCGKAVPVLLQEAIYSAETDLNQMSSRLQREQEDLQRHAASLAETALKQEAEAQRVQLERRSWQEGEPERLRLESSAREAKQQAQHLKVYFVGTLTL